MCFCGLPVNSSLSVTDVATVWRGSLVLLVRTDLGRSRVMLAEGLCGPVPRRIEALQCGSLSTRADPLDVKGVGVRLARR